MKYTATTIEGKWKECVLYKEKLRLEFNAVGKRFRDGELTATEWQEFQDNDWEPRMEWALDELHKHHMAVISGN